MVEILWLVDTLLYIHKQLTDNCDLIELARQFCAVLDECREKQGNAGKCREKQGEAGRGREHFGALK